MESSDVAARSLVEPSSWMKSAISVAQDAFAKAVDAIDAGMIKANTELIAPVRLALQRLCENPCAVNAYAMADRCIALACTFDHGSTELYNAAKLLVSPEKPLMLACTHRVGYST